MKKTQLLSSKQYAWWFITSRKLSPSALSKAFLNRASVLSQEPSSFDCDQQPVILIKI